MTESTQIQTQSQIKYQIQVIAVPKRVYNVVKSIVDSSTKPIYEWNKPIFVNEKTAKFVKYKVLPNNIEVKAWEIVVQPMVIIREGAELDADLITVYDGLGNCIARLTIRRNFMVHEDYKVYVLKIGNIEIAAKSMHEFEFYAVKPSEDIPFARPISLAAFVNKLMFYFGKALSVFKNAYANENSNM
jgi:hypothetical protein